MNAFYDLWYVIPDGLGWDETFVESLSIKDRKVQFISSSKNWTGQREITRKEAASLLRHYHKIGSAKRIR